MTNPVRARVDGWGITTATQSEAVQGIIAAASRREPLTVFTLNLDHLVKLRADDRFRAAYRNADVVTADGAPIAWLARAQDASIERATGADMVLPLSIAAADAGLPVFMFGTTRAVIAEAGRRLVAQARGLIVCGGLSPSAAFDPEGPEADGAIDAIARSGAAICYVALGAPKQELFAARAKARGLRCAMICLGASLDFITGEQARAPAMLRHLGLEWAWRLASNPRRLARRYASCAMVLADLVMVAPLREAIGRTRGSSL